MAAQREVTVFPLSDDNTDRHITPWINYCLIVLNIIVFVAFQQLGANDEFTNAFAAVPQEIATGKDIAGDIRVGAPSGGGSSGVIHLAPTPVSVYLTLLTSMFMHGGFAHIAGNMLYLWIFGDNLENLMGHFKYLFFYLLCGLAADLSHVFCTIAMAQNPLIPSLGASGAISGVLGGYILLFPHRRVTVLFMRQIMHVPAYVCLGIWIVFQLVESSGALGGSSADAGVAYAAHIGGFIAGLALVKFFTSGERQET